MSQNWKIDGALAQAEQQPRVIKIEASARPDNARLRVAAYTRVSSDSADQLHSFAAQNQYYTTLIASKAEWQVVGIYADEGITGTSTAKRDDFNRMMADCRRGLIDQILVKSISRFARNTQDCLEAIRELKTLGVNVRFERESINTADTSSELMTSIYAAFAQRESESISGNMRWSYQKRMESGMFNTCKAPRGFHLVDGKLEVNEQEADIICRIFLAYLSGQNLCEIAQSLNAENAMGRVWNSSSLDYILRNERYAGNAVLQKRYVTTDFPRKRLYNHGEREMYHVSGCNEAIIPQEIFEQVQILRQSKKAQKYPRHAEISRQIWCGCGSRVRAKQIRRKWYYCCRAHDEQSGCLITAVPERQIEEAFCRLYYKLKHQSFILEQMLENLRLIRERRMLWSPDIITLNKRISELSSQNQTLAFLKQQGLVDPDIFISKSNELARQLRQAQLDREKLVNAEGDMTAQSTRELIELLEAGPEFLDSFDAELFGELVEKVIVESNDSIRLCLKNGLELRESIERTMR